MRPSSLGQALLVVLLLIPSSSAARILEARSLGELPGLALTGASLTPTGGGAAWGALLTVGPDGGSLRIPLDPDALEGAPGLRLALECAQLSGEGGRWAFLVRDGAPVSEQPAWIGSERSTTRVVWRLPTGPPPEAVGIRFEGAATVVMGRASLSVPAGVLAPEPPLDRIANGGFELGLTGWCPYGTVAPVLRLSDGRPGSGRWCAEVTNRPALLPVVFTSWPLPQVGLPEDVGIITERAFALEPGQSYTVSMLLRADRPDAGVDLGVYQDTGSEARAHLRVSDEWRPYAIHVRAEGTQGALWIRPARDETGEGLRLWVDEVSLQPGLLQSAPRTRGSSPDLAIGPTRSHGVYDADEPLTIVLRAFGFSAGTDLPVTVEVRDGFERMVHEATVALPGAPAGGVSERVLSLPVEGQGFFSVRARWEEGGRVRWGALRLARFARYPWSDSPFGVSRGWDDDAPWQLARSAGASWAREWLGLWDAAEPEPQRRSLLTPLTFAERYEGLGYHLLACVPFPSARWGATVDEAVVEQDGVLPFVGSRAYLPDAEGSFERHVASLALGLGDHVDAIELLQEPLVSGWSLPTSRYGPSDYTDLCRRTSEALDASGWTGQLVGGAGSLPTARSERMIEALATSGLAGEVDAWNAHAYLFGLPAEALDEPVRQLSEVVGECPLWITELGVWGDDAPSPLAPHRAESALSELESADALVRAVAIVLSRGAERVFFAARSLPSHASGSGRDWIVTPSGQPRKALPAFATLARLLGPRPVPGPIVRLAEGTARLFDTHEGTLAIVSPDYGARLDVRLPGDEALDLFGNPIVGRAESDAAFYLRAAEVAPEAFAESLLAAASGPD